MSQAQNSGYGIDEMVPCIAVEEQLGGMPVGAQVSQHGSPVHAQGFPTGRGKQMIVTSFSDVTNVMLMHRVGGYIRRVHTSLRAVIWVFGNHTFW